VSSCVLCHAAKERWGLSVDYPHRNQLGKRRQGDPVPKKIRKNIDAGTILAKKLDKFQDTRANPCHGQFGPPRVLWYIFFSTNGYYHIWGGQGGGWDQEKGGTLDIEFVIPSTSRIYGFTYIIYIPTYTSVLVEKTCWNSTRELDDDG
jgi:hypothetical protein